MNPSMISALVTMQALQHKMDVIAHNVSNLNTAGYKRREVSFQDVLTSVYRQPGGFQRDGRLTPLGLPQGWGAKAGSIALSMTQGSLLPTHHPYDLAIEGDGLFEVRLPAPDENGNPEVRWTRNGAFRLMPDPADPGMMILTTAEGYPVIGTDDEPIRIPAGHTPNIDPEGRVYAIDEANPEEPPMLYGQLKIVRALRPQVLLNEGNHLFRLPFGMEPQGVLETVDLTAPEPDEEGRRRIAVRQGHLEQSNVNLADEMAELLMVQRAYQLNARAIASSDTLMSLANNLRA